MNNLLSDLFKEDNKVSKTISPENLTGEKGSACKATTGTGMDQARELGQGWKISPSLLYKSHETITIAEVKGEGVINYMWFGGDISRDTIIRIYWDFDETPAVEVPLTDFFSNAWIDNRGKCFSGPFSSLNTLVISINPNNALISYFQMPFKKGFKITLENTSENTMCTYYQINYTLQKLESNILYFHAQFRESDRVEKMKCHNVLDNVYGKGKYVGTSMAVELHGNDIWWGEGEFKFYLDGDKDFPSISSTGTEDYFLGSFDWEVDSKYQTYSTPYGGMFYVSDPDVKHTENQRFALCRWLLHDSIRFEKDIRIEVQDLGWRELGKTYEVREDYISTVSYFYLDKTSTNIPKLKYRKLGGNS